ncbi:hypothetical protein L596_016742 [Steinernema carpocapsae]|nr:hypothetical protein L596_016742 [Steinernema carpocapsae]
MRFVKAGGRLKKTGFGKDDEQAWRLCQRIFKREKKAGVLTFWRRNSGSDTQNSDNHKMAAQKLLEEELNKRLKVGRPPNPKETQQAQQQQQPPQKKPRASRL